MPARRDPRTLLTRRVTVAFLSVLLVLTLAPACVIDACIHQSDQLLTPWGLSPDSTRYIVINGYWFDPLKDAPPISPSLKYGPGSFGQPTYYVVQFDSPVGPGTKADVGAAGARVLHYAGHNSYVVWADGWGLYQLQRIPSVRWLGLFEPAYKLSPRLSDEYANALASSEGRDWDLRSSSALGNAEPTWPKMPSAVYDGHYGWAMAADALDFQKGLQLPKASDSRLEIVVLTFESSLVHEAIDAITSLGGSNISVPQSNRGIITAEIGRDALEPLAFEPSIMWIERRAQTHPFNDVARWVIQSGDSGAFATPIHDHGIIGTGQTVTVCDTGIDYNHSAFIDHANPLPGSGHRKVTDYYVPDGSSGDSWDNDICHGTHVSGTVAGDDGAWYVYDGDSTGSSGTVGPHDGQAFGATLQVQDIFDGVNFGPPSWIGELYWEALERGSWIHTNSWGAWGADYGIDAMFTDEFLWDNQDLVVLLAAGNSGKEDRGLNNIAAAKNVISVGASLNGPYSNSLAWFSSRGPTLDGRLKPDVIAPGVSIWSARGNSPFPPTNDYWQMSGTSMATPMVAGAAALVREYFVSGWYPMGVPTPAHVFTPSAALVKATVINSASEMSGLGAYDMGERRYPNNNQGWGLVTLDDALYFRGDGRRLVVEDNRAGLSTGEMKRYEIKVADVTMPLEITLVWTDYPAQAWADPILVNDLDLIVTAPDGTAYRGNAFTGYNPGESEPGAANADHMNNVESVLVISGVQTGIWTVEVAGCNVPEGPQPFALSMTGGFVSEQGSLSMDRERYRSSALVNLTLSDLGLNTDSDSVESAVVSVNSTTEPVPEVLTLTETGAATAVFAGQVQLVLSPVPTAGDGILQVQNGDALTIEYIDADDGFGASQSVFDWARVDDDPPVISGVRTGEIRFSRATVLWSTDEPSDSVVFYDSSLPLSMSAGSGSEVSVHEVVLSDLQEDTTYYFSVRSADGAGNVRTDDNGGSYYTFSTPGRPPPPPVGSDWSTLRSNSARTGEIESKMAPPLAEEIVMGPYVVWSADEPIFVDGVFYSIVDLEGMILAIDPFSRTVLWERALGDPLFYTGTPAYNNDTIYATFYGYSGGKVYALDALTGQTKWCIGPESGLDFNARIGMAYADGLVFGTSWNGEVYALNASDGSTVWSYQTDLLPWSGSAVSEGRVFVPIVEGYLVALDEFTGLLLWSVPIPNIGYTSLVPVASAGVLYMVVGDTIYSLNAADGTILWQTSGLPFGWGRTSPAFDGSALYWGAYDIVDGLGYFWAVNASDGSIIWRTPVGPTDICSSIAYSNGYVYGATFASDLYTLRAADGAVVDVDPLLRLGFGYPVRLVASDGWVWVEDGDGWLRGFRAQVPAGLTVSPAHQSVNARPGSISDCVVEVRNTGSIATDTFDVVVSSGAHGWPVTLLDADSMLPLVDTDVDGLLDSGPISSNASVSIVVRVSVPVASLQGDEEVCSADFISSSDPSIWRKATVRTVLPMPGVIVEGSRFIASASGSEETAIINITNSGSVDDVFDLDVSSSLGWSFGLLDESGTTPLQDNDGDGRIDTGVVQGLGKTSILLKVQVAAGAALDAVNRVMIAATSSLDTNLSDRVYVRIEVLAPPPSAWPSFQHDSWRSGNASDPVALPIWKVWTYPGTGFGSLYTSPIAANGTVFYSSSSGYLMAVDAFTGEGKWALKLGSEDMAISTPTYNEGVVYIAYCEANSPRSQISALDAGTAAILWTNSMLGWTRGAPVLKGGVVFLGDYYGAIYAFNATSGEQVWLGQVHGGIAWSISIIDGLLIGGTVSGELFAMDLDGSFAWSFLSQGTIMAAPCGGGGRVYISESQGTLWALDSQTGEVLWTRMNVGWPPLGSPAYEGETVYYASHMGVFAFDAGNGSTRWRVTGDNVQFFGSPIVSNGTVFAVQYQGFLYAIDAETGLVSYALLANTWSFGSSPASAYGYVYVLDEEGVLCAFTYAGGPDLPPTVNAGPDQVVPQGANVMFDGSMSSDDYGILSYNWTILELGIEMSGVNPRHLFLDAGVFTVELVVTDCIGQVSSPDYMTVTLEDCVSPVAEAGPDQTINLGEEVILNGSGCTDNVGVVNWTWSFYDNGWRSLHGELVTYTFSAPGNYTVTLQAYDARGNIASDWMTVNVNAPPVADAGPDQIVMGGELVLFDGSASYDDVNIVNWTWTFDYDGSTVVLYGPNPTFTFWIEGVYEVTLTVNDTAGHTSTDTVQITVSGMIPEFPTLLLPVIGMAAVVLVSRLRKRR